jgi:putative glutamine amidotransferase
MSRAGADVTPVIGVAFPDVDYVAALERAGAQVRVLTPEDDLLPGALDECDGLLLTGGADVDPAEYGDPDRHSTVEIDPRRDRYEIALARKALADDVPLLAICRGAQVLNVAAGGTLIQDIPSHHDQAIDHAVNVAKTELAHEILIAKDSCLATLVTPRAAGGLAVNSRHHQAVKTVAPGFVASATSPDGLIEAIERPDARFCLAVQWHPENFWRTGEFGGLFEGLVRAAAGRRGRHP